MQATEKTNHDSGLQISVLATNLLRSDYDSDRLIEETNSLLTFIKSVYPQDYEIYIGSKFSDINPQNVKEVLKKVLTMNTYNSL